MNFIVKLFQCFFCWRVKASSEEELKTAEVIIDETFGLGKDKPCKSNRTIAAIIREMHGRYHLPLVLHWETTGCLLNLPKAFIVKGHRIQGKYLDTYESLWQKAAFCRRNGWKRAILIAQPHHYWRCVMTARKLGLEVLTVDVSSVLYDIASIQRWTKSAAVFIPYEVGARLFYFFTGKI